MDLEFGVLLIVWHIIGFGIIVNSIQFLKAAVKKRDLAILFVGIVYFGCGALSILFSSGTALLGDFDTIKHQETVRLTYVWTFVVSLLISYFLFPYIAKTKKFKTAMKKSLYEKEDAGSLSHSYRKSPLIEKFEDIFIVIIYLALFLGVMFVLVKIVKYFWYL